MQVELTIDDLREIVYGMQGSSKLLDEKLIPLLQEQEDLLKMDFDDCAGGACKL